MTPGNFFRYYNRLNGADRYFLVFTHQNMVWVADLRHIASTWCYKTRESTKNGGWEKWMLKASLLPKERLVKHAVCLMTVAEFEAQRKASHLNRGYFCEKLVCDRLNCTPASSKKNARFDECGDVVMNGVQYQVKFENATLTNVNVLHHAQADARAKRRAQALPLNRDKNLCLTI